MKLRSMYCEFKIMSSFQCLSCWFELHAKKIFFNLRRDFNIISFSNSKFHKILRQNLERNVKRKENIHVEKLEIMNLRSIYCEFKIMSSFQCFTYVWVVGLNSLQSFLASFFFVNFCTSNFLLKSQIPYNTPAKCAKQT